MILTDPKTTAAIEILLLSTISLIAALFVQDLVRDWWRKRKNRDE
jgi:hypothetical protein